MNATIRLSLSSVLLMVAGGLAAYAPAALAQTSTLTNAATGRCLAGNSLGAVVTQICSGAAIYPQVWDQVNTGSGFLIRNTRNGRCLDNNAAGNVFTSPCNPASATQRWVRVNTSATAAGYRSVGTNRYFGSSSTGMVISSSTPSSSQFIWLY